MPSKNEEFFELDDAIFEEYREFIRAFTKYPFPAVFAVHELILSADMMAGMTDEELAEYVGANGRTVTSSCIKQYRGMIDLTLKWGKTLNDRILAIQNLRASDDEQPTIH